MDPRIVEWINLEIDGRLDAAGRAELDACAASDPAVRARREQLRRVARALASAPAPELPSGFREAVLAAAAGRRAPRRRPRAWRGVLALAASLVAVAVVLQVVERQPAGPGDSLAGALAPATATVGVEPAEGGLRLTFDLPAGAPGEVVIEFAGSGRRIVLPRVEAGRSTVQVAVNPGDSPDFTATLVRDGVATPIARRTR